MPPARPPSRRLSDPTVPPPRSVSAAPACGSGPGSGAPGGAVQPAPPVPAEPSVATGGEPPPNLAVEPLPLPILHGDVPGEGVEQVDVGVGVIDEFPVEGC